MKMYISEEMGRMHQVNCRGISAVLACFTGLFFYRAKKKKTPTTSFLYVHFAVWINLSSDDLAVREEQTRNPSLKKKIKHLLIYRV